MLQVFSRVRLRCDQCRDTLVSRTGVTDHPSVLAAHAAASEVGWRDDLGGRWWCSACAPVLACQEWGHEFTTWRRAAGHGGFYRYCQRCCLHERHAPGNHPLTRTENPDQGGAGVGLPAGELA